MSSAAAASPSPTALPAVQRGAPIGRPGRPRRKPAGERALTPRVRRLIGLMVWEGLNRPDAAAQVGLSDDAAYRAFRKPGVMALYRAECEVLRESTKAGNIRTAVEIRDAAAATAADNRNRLDAAKWLHGEPDGRASVNVSVNVAPGYVIDLSERSGPVIEGEARVMQPANPTTR